MKRTMISVLMLTLVALTAFGAGKTEAAPAAATPTKATLDVMMSFPRFTEQMEAYLDQFKAKMLKERNIEVSINLEMPSSDQYDNSLQTRLSSNDAPDLFTLHASAKLPIYQEAGYLEDLSGQPFASTLYPNVKDTVSIDGKVYAVPFESTVWGYLYNKDIFEECGLKVPETLDDMKNVVKVLKEKGYTPFLLAYQEQWVPQLMTALALGGKVSGNVPDWVERMHEDKGSYSEVSDIFDIIELIMANGTPRAMETGSEQGAANFANGRAAMYVQGTWSAESILSVNPKMRIGVGALPVNNDPACTLVNLATTTSLAVYSRTTEKELALALVNYILDQEASSKLYESMKFNPVSTVHKFDQFPWAKDASAYVAAGRAYRDLVLPSAVTDEQGKLLQSLYVKNIDRNDFIATMDKTFAAANKARNQ